jgi:plastocyanin domain-containing protein
MIATFRTAALSLSLSLASVAPGALSACSGDAGAEGPVQNRVEMAVTDKGFVPQNLRVKKGEPVTLIITRKTDVTCATELVIDEHNINVKLPLNQPVTVSFTPLKSGELKYGCAMKKMIGGVIKVL